MRSSKESIEGKIIHCLDTSLIESIDQNVGRKSSHCKEPSGSKEREFESLTLKQRH